MHFNNMLMQKVSPNWDCLYVYVLIYIYIYIFYLSKGCAKMIDTC